MPDLCAPLTLPTYLSFYLPLASALSPNRKTPIKAKKKKKTHTKQKTSQKCKNALSNGLWRPPLYQMLLGGPSLGPISHQAPHLPTARNIQLHTPPLPLAFPPPPPTTAGQSPLLPGRPPRILGITVPSASAHALHVNQALPFESLSPFVLALDRSGPAGPASGP